MFSLTTNNITGGEIENLRINDFVYLSLLVVEPAIMVLQVFSSQPAQAQFIHSPPPGSDSQPSHPRQVGKYNSIPPDIEFLTTSLRQGKNVIKVKVLDDAPIDFVQIKEAKNGKVIADRMVANPNNVYKSLIDVESSSKVIVVLAFDINGNYSEVAKKFDVPIVIEFDRFHKGFLWGHLSPLRWFHECHSDFIFSTICSIPNSGHFLVFFQKML